YRLLAKCPPPLPPYPLAGHVRWARLWVSGYIVVASSSRSGGGWHLEHVHPSPARNQAVAPQQGHAAVGISAAETSIVRADVGTQASAGGQLAGLSAETTRAPGDTSSAMAPPGAVSA